VIFDPIHLKLVIAFLAPLVLVAFALMIHDYIVHRRK